ncbi:septation protein SepH [Nocardioides marmoriginsengisoli]|nr:septation protein SepH [Nocardioides marmoriginsengisoli]
MQHLTPVGLNQDGTELVLTSDSGEEFAVRVDQRLRTALRGDNARLGQLEMKMESALRPRDIQSRIRAGESAEDVAAAAQTTVDAIMAFAAPVLAERAHVAQTAVKSSIRRASADSSPVGRTLDEASRQHLMAISVRADQVEWDAWRRDDGRWHLAGMYEAQGSVHLAEFTYDQPGRYVVADNDEALLLTGEATAPAAAAEPTGRRLAAVPAPGAEELPLGDDALELVREREVETPAEPTPEQPPVAEATVEVPVTAAPVAEAPASEQGAFDDLGADHADADWIAVVPDEAPVAPTDERPADEPAEEPAGEAVDVAPEPVEDAPPRKKGRSSVPSWDEIMFGGGKND